MRPSRAAAGFGPAACLLTFICLLALSGCAWQGRRGALIEPPAGGARQTTTELTDTPFFPQRAHQCGPAALATVLGASGVPVTPDDLEPLVYLPKKHGSLQIEMQAAPRKYARLTYSMEPELTAIIGELAAGRPVLVLHNYGLPFWPRWHYAVVIGYDARQDNLVLRSGTTRRQTLSARTFMRAWDNGGRWALVILKPGELPATADRVRYLEAAAAFERLAQSADARLAFDAAVKRWPDEPIAWIGRGTAHYRGGHLDAAADDYSEALRLDGSQAGARNNLAMTLLDLGCARQAHELLESMDPTQLERPLAGAVRDTRMRIDARLSISPIESCRRQSVTSAAE